jgi:spore coat polysaccharide biosynthesis protein SpsF
MNTVAIVQARLRSTRLPYKVLAEIHDEPMLARQLARMRLARELDQIVVAIPSGPADDHLMNRCIAEGWDFCRGPEEDVLARYLEAAEAAGADTVVRVTADCPLIDPFVIDAAVILYRHGAPGPFDFVSNNLLHTFPHGLDVEVMSRGTLAIAAAKATDPYDREHVTPWITRADAGGRIFRLGNLPSPEDLSMYRLTVDYPEDLELMRRIWGELGPGYISTRDVIALLRSRPDLMRINARHRRQWQPVGTA